MIRNERRVADLLNQPVKDSQAIKANDFKKHPELIKLRSVALASTK